MAKIEAQRRCSTAVRSLEVLNSPAFKILNGGLIYVLQHLDLLVDKEEFEYVESALVILESLVREVMYLHLLLLVGFKQVAKFFPGWNVSLLDTSKFCKAPKCRTRNDGFKF